MGHFHPTLTIGLIAVFYQWLVNSIAVSFLAFTINGIQFLKALLIDLLDCILV